MVEIHRQLKVTQNREKAIFPPHFAHTYISSKYPEHLWYRLAGCQCHSTMRSGTMVEQVLYHLWQYETLSVVFICPHWNSESMCGMCCICCMAPGTSDQQCPLLDLVCKICLFLTYLLFVRNIFYGFLLTVKEIDPISLTLILSLSFSIMIIKKKYIPNL